jgi:hypothetical protein
VDAPPAVAVNGIPVDLLVITDGRRTVVDAIASAEENLYGAELTRWLYDDSGDAAHRAWLAETFPDWSLFWHRRRQGFGGAIRAAWAHLRANGGAPWIFHLEDDFTFRRPVPLDELAAVLELRPDVAQLALRRQPWNPTERDAGGLIEVAPADYVDTVTGGHRWLEHRKFWTTNPALYRRSLIERRDWPRGEHSEGRFGLELFAAGDVVGYWGGRSSGEWVHHIGDVRAGTGY